MSKKYDVVARTGTYTNNAGEEKGRYKNVGMVYEKEGKLGLLIDTPIVLNDEGQVVKFFGLYEPKEKTGTSKPAGDDFGNDKPPF